MFFSLLSLKLAFMFMAPENPSLLEESAERWKEIHSSSVDSNPEQKAKRWLRGFQLSLSDQASSQLHWILYWQLESSQPGDYSHETELWVCPLQSDEACALIDDAQIEVAHLRPMASRSRLDPLYAEQTFSHAIWWDSLEMQWTALQKKEGPLQLKDFLPIRFWQDRLNIVTPLYSEALQQNAYCHFHVVDRVTTDQFDCHFSEMPLTSFLNEIQFEVIEREED